MWLTGKIEEFLHEAEALQKTSTKPKSNRRRVELKKFGGTCPRENVEFIEMYQRL